jgi:hypothetical protein
VCVSFSLSRSRSPPWALLLLSLSLARSCSLSLALALSRSLVRSLSRSLHLEVRMPVLTLLIKLQVFNMQLLVFASPFLQIRVVRDRRCRCSVFFCILFLVQIAVTAGPCRPSSPPPLFCVFMCYHSLARCLLPSRAHTYTALTRTHVHHTPLTLTNKTHTTHTRSRSQTTHHTRAPHTRTRSHTTHSKTLHKTCNTRTCKEAFSHFYYIFLLLCVQPCK